MRSWGALGLALPAVLFCPLASFAGTAPGAPGARPTWTSGNKQGLGTAASPRSHVWFTLGDGALQEVYYPTVDTAETRLLELVVLDGGRLEEETADTEHHVHLLDPHALAFEQVNTAKTGRYRIRKVTLTDPERDTVLVHARFEPLGDGPFRVFVLFDPAIANSGLHDSGEARKDALLASKRQISAALSASPPFSQTHIGYRDSSDGMGSLRSSGTLPGYTRAPDGNVAGMAEVTLGGPGEFTLALGFGPGPASALESAEASLKEPFDAVLAAYTAGWTAYLAPLRKGPEPFGTAVAEAAMILKAHEDKTHPGAFVASLTIPWGDSADASKGGVGGYHLVWSRDLYHVATALLALGDRASAERALDYLFTVQQRPDGSFPQNTWLDGRPFWSSLQLDEVADPLILALDLNRTDPKTFKAHIRPAAEFILRTGPKTPQERW
ncbi:MAG TPA: glycoside hydrolase family 15 protein, partial [Vicinamibacteria bacterium]|nr:glycoside hydrolase family 15 protein [Vicinamibacteria bacterium]